MRFLLLGLILALSLCNLPVWAEWPDAADARALLHLDGAVTVDRTDEGVPDWTVSQGGAVVGYLGSTWEVAQSVG